MDRNELKHSPAIPAGFARIRSGPIRPGDLLAVWPAGGWLRYDSPEWLGAPIADAGDAVCVIRKAAFDARAEFERDRFGQTGADLAAAFAIAERTYKINRDPPPAANAGKDVAGSAKQLSLFGEI